MALSSVSFLSVFSHYHLNRPRIGNLQDIGGGLGIDYDGSKTSFEASINYTVEELRTFAFARFLCLSNFSKSFTNTRLPLFWR